MPEGDTLRRLAGRITERFAGQRVLRSVIRDPRIATVDFRGRVLVDADAYGKHLFLRFDDGRSFGYPAETWETLRLLDFPARWFQSGRTKPEQMLTNEVPAPSLRALAAMTGIQSALVIPLMRGEPSLRSVAIVRCLYFRISSFARAASSGAAPSTSTQRAMTRSIALKPCARTPITP